MLEKIIDVLKILLDKHLIPALCSIVVTAILFYITPTSNPILLKLGRSFFIFVIFVIVFLIIKFIMFCFNNVKYSIEKYQYQKNKQRNKIAEYFDLLDSLEPWKFSLIEYLLENENENITTYKGIFEYEYDLHFFINLKETILKQNISSVDPRNLKNKYKFQKEDYVVQIKLNEQVYSDSKHIKNKYGKISRF